jgi:mRNA-degrading endonuclease RelE of RelBE toxin-antitoxin system
MPYRLWVKDEAKRELRELPGHIRQRIRNEIEQLKIEPRPPISILMEGEFNLSVEVRRIRLGNWRVIYIVDQEFFEVGVLAVRKRPPYDYADLAGILARLN